MILAAAYARTLAPSITWANGGADSGDLVAAAAVLGVAHPSGYPTYLLLARLFQLIPAGDLAFRANLLSATAAILAALVVYQTAAVLLGDEGWIGQVSGAGAALACGLAPLLWSQAVIAEVYALNALFAALLLRFSLQALRGRAVSRPALLGQGILAGLALGNHLTIGLLVAAWLVALATGPHPRLAALATPSARRRERRGKWPALSVALLGLCIGALVYLYLPLRAAACPAVSWGGADSWPGFWWMLSGEPYRRYDFDLSAQAIGARAGATLALLYAQFGLIGLGLATAGVFAVGPAERRYLALSGFAAAGFTVFAVYYDVDGAANYVIPALVIAAIWIGAGLGAALRAIRRRRPALAVLAAACVALLILAPAPARAAAVDASHDNRATAFAAIVMAAAPSGAILIVTDDQSTFPLWYAHYALGERPDLALIVDPLLDFAWYRANLRATYPALRIPDPIAGDWPHALAAANGPARPVCTVDATAAPPLSCPALAELPSYQSDAARSSWPTGSPGTLRSHSQPMVQ